MIADIIDRSFHHVSWDEAYSFARSSYGDPESALISLGEPVIDPDAPIFAKEDHALMTELLGLLSPQDRIIMALDARGCSQPEIARQIGRSQPSVCVKLKSVKRWLALVFPLRRALADDPSRLPPSWESHPERTHFWTMLVETHAPKFTVAAIGGYRVGPCERRTFGDVLAEGSPSQRSVASLLAGPWGYRWTAPSTERVKTR